MTHRAAPRSAGDVLLALSAVFLAIIAAALVVLPVTGAAGPRGPVLPGTGLAADRIDPPPAGGVGVRRVPDRPTGPRSGVEDGAVAAIVDDLDTYWSQTTPQIAGVSFTPLRGGMIAIDSSTSAAAGDSAPCVASPASIAGNAYYCPDDDGIVFDSSALVPVLLGHYGSAGLAAAFAHEFGHAIQARIGPTAADRAAHPEQYPSLLIEGQGDCYAGSFLAWVIAGHATSLHLTDGTLLAAIGPLVDFRDPVTVPATDSTAHGWGLDRFDSVLLGYREGAGACHSMTLSSQHAIQGTVPVPSGADASMTTPRYPTTQAALAAAAASIAAFTGAPVTATATDADLAAAGPYGQFATATALALAVGRSRAGGSGSGAGGSGSGAGGSGSGAEIDVRAACFAGAWAVSVYGKAPAGALGSWPGDADEGLDLVRSRPDATFADAAGYADGFRSGMSACG